MNVRGRLSKRAGQSAPVHRIWTVLIVFLDSNVLISACLRRDHKFLEFWRLHNIVPATSMYVVSEVRKHLFTPEQHERFNHLLARTKIVAEADERIIPTSISLPSTDRPVLAATTAARVDFLITGDRKHFSQFFGRPVSGTAVMLPADFLERYQYRLIL